MSLIKSDLHLFFCKPKLLTASVTITKHVDHVLFEVFLNIRKNLNALIWGKGKVVPRRYKTLWYNLNAAITMKLAVRTNDLRNHAHVSEYYSAERKLFLEQSPHRVIAENLIALLTPQTH